MNYTAVSFARLATLILGAVVFISIISATPVFAADLDDGGWFDDGMVYGGGGYSDSGWFDDGMVYGDSYSDSGWFDDGMVYGGGDSDSGWFDDGMVYGGGDSDSGWFDDGVVYDDECGCYEYDDDYEDVYYDEESKSYSYGSGGGSYGSNKGYSTGGGYYMKPMTFSSPSYPSKPSYGGGSSSYNSSVTNTNITNTNIDNSINDSFNNYNSNNVVVATPIPATPQYPVVYTQPAPYCQIYQSQASGSGVMATYLSWTSSNATSAYLSSVGSVNTNGSQTVWGAGSRTYVLTVYGYNGQQTNCQTTVNAYSAPYVSLTQIPYTGFDLGTFGNAMYWAGLVVFAMGAGYLAVYYIPSLAFAGARSERKYAPVVAAMAPVMVAKEAAAVKVQPIVEAIRKSGTNDAMAIVTSKDGSMPKIVISRD